MSGGVTSRRAFERLSRSDRRHYEPDLEIPKLVREGLARSPRQAFRRVYGRMPSGADYARLERSIGGAFVRERGRLQVKDNDLLWRGDEPLPIPTADGVFDAVPERMSWRQRSVIGEYWSLVGTSKHLTDAELERKLRPFRRETFRVLDDQGRIVRKVFITDVEGFRAFARSPQARQERVISPNMSPNDLGGSP